MILCGRIQFNGTTLDTLKWNYVRIGSNNVGDLLDVAFKTPDGQKVLIVLNSGSYTTTFNIRFRRKTVSPTLAAGAVGTFIWK